MDVLLLGGLGSKTFLWTLWENVNTSWKAFYSLLIFCGLEPWTIEFLGFFCLFVFSFLSY